RARRGARTRQSRGVAEGKVIGDREARVELVLDAVVRSGVEMAARAGLLVAADIHVPEQRLAEDDRPRPALDERIQVSGERHLDSLERRWKDGGWMRRRRRLSGRNRGKADCPGQEKRRR